MTKLWPPGGGEPIEVQDKHVEPMVGQGWLTASPKPAAKKKETK